MSVEAFNFLLNKFMRGDKNAFEKLYSYLLPKIVNAFNGKTGDPNFGNEVAHVFFCKIREKKIEGIGYVKYPISWCITICRNEVINFMIKKARENNATEEYLASLKAAAVSDVYDIEGAFGSLTDAVNKLEPRERKIIFMREALGYSYKEIAFEVGESYGNIRQIHSRACKKLKNFVTKR